jgi:selenocysteine lyase/cysteine desulfurase
MFHRTFTSRFDGIRKNALMKPGFTRFNLSYFASDEEVDYILNALEFIANDGWKFLPLVEII